MIETPAAAMLADQIARAVDFISIGSNDLAQYGLAMDRGHAELAARIDGLHPAVLRLIAATTRGAAVHDRPVAVCGGLASDPEAVPLLLGLGVTELSVVPSFIPRLKSLIRGLRLEDCRALARRAQRSRHGRRSPRAGPGGDVVKQLIARLQPIGRALMLPIAVLPVAALLLRLGQPDLLNLAAVAAAGAAIFANLGLLFAIGVAVGLARENHGAAGLASVVGYLVATHAARVLIAVPPGEIAGLADKAAGLAAAAFREAELSKLSVPLGLLSGLFAGWAYNRFSDIRLPELPGVLRRAAFRAHRVRVFALGLGARLRRRAGRWWSSGMDAISRAVLGSESWGCSSTAC